MFDLIGYALLRFANCGSNYWFVTVDKTISELTGMVLTLNINFSLVDVLLVPLKLSFFSFYSL
jgi:hypothetical protein